MKYTDRELEDILNKLIASTRSPRGRFSAASSYPQLEKKLNFRNRRLYLTRTFAAAAAVVLLCLSVWTAYLYMQPATIQTVSTLAETRTVHLPDGTSVTLNHYSSLSYPERFKSDNREVELSGEAYFEVARQTGKHKFTVESKLMTVIVHGTIFNMKSYDNGTVAETSLIEGEVLVESGDDDSKIILLPGQKAIVEEYSHKMVVKETNSLMDGIWRNNMVPFQNATIQDIAKVLEDLYHIRIEVHKDIDLVHTYSGMIEKKEKLEDVMRTLQNSIPIKYKIESDKVLIEPME